MTEKADKRPSIGVGVLVWKDRQLLLGERLAAGQPVCWQFPGGYLENGESVIDCARREVLEETGIKVRALRHLGYTDRQFELAGKIYITLLVSCEYDSGDAVVLEPEKCAGWQWFDYQQLPEPLFEPITRFLEQLREAPARTTKDDLYALHCASHVPVAAPSGEHK